MTELLLELYVVSDGAFAARTVRQALQYGADLPLGGFDLGMERAGGDAQRPVAEDDDLLGERFDGISGLCSFSRIY